jgi:hypothetical protein
VLIPVLILLILREPVVLAVLIQQLIECHGVVLVVLPDVGNTLANTPTSAGRVEPPRASAHKRARDPSVGMGHEAWFSTLRPCGRTFSQAVALTVALARRLARHRGGERQAQTTRKMRSARYFGGWNRPQAHRSTRRGRSRGRKHGSLAAGALALCWTAKVAHTACWEPTHATGLGVHF